MHDDDEWLASKNNGGLARCMLDHNEKNSFIRAYVSSTSNSQIKLLLLLIS
jgi:hypothetical protein